MEFRPCIDIHNGKVKQLVGGSLRDEGDAARENFVSEQDAVFYAELYKKNRITGGHVILLNSKASTYYRETKQQALAALYAFPGGLQVGGGISPENAEAFLDAGASHVIVTSYVFRNGEISREHLKEMTDAVGSSRLVLDVSCRKKDGIYYVVTDRWQKFTQVPVTLSLLEELGENCAEFLVHAVDVEGKAGGIETELVEILAGYTKRPITYAGGVGSLEDLELLRQYGQNRLNVTIGSALDLFGGKIPFERVLALTQNRG